MSVLRTKEGIALLFVGIAFSQSVQDAKQCKGTTYDVRTCLSKVYEKADAELNTAYSTALKEVSVYSDPNRHIDNLRLAERLWIAYRDAQCKAQYELFEGGTGGPIERLGCLIEMTNKRSIELKRVYFTPH